MIHPSRKAKLKWQCRRGMLELDLILLPFVNNNLDQLTEAQFDAFELLLSNSDPVLYAYLMGTEIPADREQILIVELIQRQHSAG